MSSLFDHDIPFLTILFKAENAEKGPEEPSLFSFLMGSNLIGGWLSLWKSIRSCQGTKGNRLKLIVAILWQFKIHTMGPSLSSFQPRLLLQSLNHWNQLEEQCSRGSQEVFVLIRNVVSLKGIHTVWESLRGDDSAFTGIGGRSREC